ncbi:MAG TPA: hypothetical protein DDW54_01405 [Clostridiales bacterium]|nr:hypothetical protein [Clostridiales bacterium]
MEAEGVEIPREEPVEVYIAPMGEEAGIKAFKIVKELREKGIKAETDHVGRGFKAQFRYADKIGAEYVAAIGENELSSGAVKLKKMSDGTQTEIKLDDLSEFFAK